METSSERRDDQEPQQSEVLGGDDLAVIAPEGELDLHAARALAPHLDEAVGAAFPVVIVDLSAVTFLDSTGLGGIVQAHLRLQRQGRSLRVVVPPGSAAAVLIDLSGLGSALTTYATRELAIAAGRP